MEVRHGVCSDMILDAGQIEASNATRFGQRGTTVCVGWGVNFIGKDKVYKDEKLEMLCKNKTKKQSAPSLRYMYVPYVAGWLGPAD